MGIDIHGWIEKKQALLDSKRTNWFGMINIDSIFVADSGMYGCLFGVGNRFQFKPIVDIRGLPDDVSLNVINDNWVGMSHSHTWMTQVEIDAIDWNEMSLKNTKFTYVDKLGQHCQMNRKVSRQEMLDWDRQWQYLFEIMQSYSDEFGSDNIRLVVYFDS